MKSRLILEDWIVGIMICLMVVMVAIQVLSRYFLHTSLSYTEELVRYGFVWATFLGASSALKKGRHLSITGVVHLFPGHVRIRFKAISFLAGLVFFAVLIISGIGIMILQYRTRQTTAALGLPMWIVGSIIPASAVIAGIRLCARARRSSVEE